MCNGHSDVVVDAPIWLRNEGRETVALDACISEVVPQLWECGIVTLSSCCGHGDGAPSLVLAQNEIPFAARRVLSEIDDRAWEIFQWQLVDVSTA